MNLHLSNKSKRIPFPGSGFRFSLWLRFLQVWSPALLRHTSNSLEDVEHWYVGRMFSWVSRHLGEGWVTEAKYKDTGKELLRLIITKDKYGWFGVSQVRKNWIGFKGGGGGYVSHSRKGGYMNLQKIYFYVPLFGEQR